MLYDVPLKNLPKTSPRTILRLASANITSIGDLLEIIPFRYEDYRNILPIADIHAHYLTTSDESDNALLSKNKVTIQGVIEKKTNIFARKGFSMQKVTLRDESGHTTLTWFNQPFLLRLFKEGERMAVAGSIRNSNGSTVLQPESYELLQALATPIHTSRIVPIYSSIPGISTRTLREKIYSSVMLYGKTATECLPSEVISSHLLSMNDVYSHLHFPEDVAMLMKARERMSFNELFSIQLKMQLIRKEWHAQYVDEPMSKDKKASVQDFIATLPYELTNAQKRVTDEILNDMSSPQPMNRLLQGDVGSGKTVITLLAALFAFYNSKKVLYMAPTEILAQQHLQTLSKLCDVLTTDKKPSICLMTNNSKPTDEEFTNADLIIGTHALITSKKSFDHIGLVIVDEQHKFGVMQRGALNKRGLSPHMLSLTATPIPRTVMLTLYGELDISVIDEFPKGRKEIKTYVTPEQKREKAYEWIKMELAAHHQAFIVCPFIEQSESETLLSVKAAAEEIKRIESVFKGFTTALLHGRLKPVEKDLIMKSFADGNIDILVSTPVVEVGIDVPNATIIVIEGAERFGLAQLHQLRGRVGRSELQSHCLLFTTSPSPKVEKRLAFFAKTNNGFELARFDLSHRGGGNIFGTQQHGYAPIALETLLDTKLIEDVQHSSSQFLEAGYSYQDFPYLVKRLHSFKYEEIAHN